VTTALLQTKTTDIATEENSKQESLWKRIERDDLTRITIVAALIAGAFWVYCLGNFPIALFAIHCTLADIILLTAGIIGSKPILSEAKEALLEKRMNMELSMAIALTAALAIGEFLTVALIILFVLIAEEIEKLTIERGRRSIKSLLGSLPQEIFVEDEAGEIKTITISAAQPGQIAVIKPGSHIAIDGLVISGNSTVEQSSITGEMLPVSKEVGSIVYAGTTNQSGALRVRIEKTGVETAYGKLLKAIEEAENSPAPIENIADKLSGYLVYLALAWAAITFLCTKDLPSTISVIVVAGACGVAAGTPLAILGAIGQAARSGVILKAGSHLETMAKLQTIVFDKTGTLTLGQPLVTRLLPTRKFTESALLSAAATCELFSEHPLARAIKANAQEKNIALKAPDQFEYLPGQGVVCRLDGRQIIAGTASLLAVHDINIISLDGLTMPLEMSETSVFVAVDKEFAGAILTADKIRPEASDVIKQLDALGIRSVLLSGDSGESVKAIAKQTGIAEYKAGMLPAEKSDYIKLEQGHGQSVAMIGDGINDAPALVTANIGIAIGSGTDIALQSADAMLVKNNLLNLVDSIVIARRCYGIIWFNFVGTIVVDVIGMALASSGHLNPLAAALVHVGSELFFIFNSARLLTTKE
jgi:Cd2+/Zn2+-exporting ATPase/Cu+-exporting ATPase